MSTFGSDTAANTLLQSLIGLEDFDIEEIDLNDPLYQVPDGSGDLYTQTTKPTNDDLTERKVGGDGSYDAIIAGAVAHLNEEYEKGRITGDNYAKVYSEIVANSMSGAIQFLLGKETAYWNAVNAQLQAKRGEVDVITARIGLATAKAQMQQTNYQALTTKVQYAVSKIALANEDAKYANLLIQKDLLGAQLEAATAQYSDFLSDGTTLVAGQLGKQKELYEQQITSYERDIDIKGAKIYVDAWIAMKTIDEGLDPVDNFTNSRVNDVLNKVGNNFFDLPNIAET